MDDLSPICISAYTRLSHLKSNINSLKKNKLASDSNLYIFSDAPKEGDEEKVALARDYMHRIDGFKRVKIIERTTNGFLKNALEGIEYLLCKYGRLIFLEEDIVTSPYFLNFMNKSLSFYENNLDVFSVTGYSPPIDWIANIDEDAIFLPRFNAWGFGIWENRYSNMLHCDSQKISNLIENRRNRKYIKQYFGEDALLMFHLEREGIINAWDVRAMYHQVLSRQFTLYPKRSLVQNIGHDGSGLHCTVTEKYATKLSELRDFRLPETSTLIDVNLTKNFEFRRLDMRNRCVLLLRNCGLYSFLKSLRKIFLRY